MTAIEDGVSASDFVRNFRQWQDRALKAPVYIRHHGRARFVLTTVELMRALTEGYRATVPDDTRDELIDTIDSLLILTDDDLNVETMSRPARSYFSGVQWRGQPIESLFHEQARRVVVAAATRVQDGGMPETLEVRSTGPGERRLELTIQRYGSGIAVVGRDRTAEDERLAAVAGARALGETAEMLGTIAVVRINLRGYITDTTTSFEAMTGLPGDAIASVRFPTLFDVASRVAVGEAMEAVIRSGEPTAIDARLLVNRGAPTPVRLGLSAAMIAAGVDTLIGTVVIGAAPAPTSPISP